jgi:hypothetical protein
VESMIGGCGTMLIRTLFVLGEGAVIGLFQ